jgi:hypothetical protein
MEKQFFIFAELKSWKEAAMGKRANMCKPQVPLKLSLNVSENLWRAVSL